MDDLALPDLFRRLAALGSLDRLLEIARDEDLAGAGDVTTESIVDPRTPGSARLVAREAGVVAGLATADAIARSFHVALELEPHCEDGEACTAGQAIADVHASLHDMLLVERTLLNLVGRLSGIATTTRRYVDLVAGTRARICATRKTTPGLRHLEKYAVRCGGGGLHRLGLHDAALYKDNHLAGIPAGALAATLAPAIQAARASGNLAFVEVEVDTLSQLRDVLQLEPGLVDYVLLDNMTVNQMSAAVTIRDELAPGVQLEASGGVTEASVRPIAETGVDRISVGALTHSVASLDVGLDVTTDLAADRLADPASDPAPRETETRAMNVPAERVDLWAGRLEAAVKDVVGAGRIVVLAETGSTQDAARRGGAVPGDVFVAARQTAGRGRHGRVWADTGDDGIAVTMAATRDTPQRLVMASAVGVARALERHAGGSVGGVGIKWPNDVMIDGRKIAGILVEQTEVCALIGIGVNVGQSAWPAALEGRAVSLRQIGGDVARVEVLETLLIEVSSALGLAEDALVDAFAMRDVLTGTTGRFRCGEQVVEGRVARVDPIGGITVVDGAAEVFLDAATCVRES